MLIMLLILDVDGVLTNGKKYYDTSGRGVLKTFCDRDFTAIKKFKAAGWHVVFLSGDPNVNEAVAKNRNIPFYCNRVDGKMVNKVTFLDKLCAEYNVRKDQTVYIGDDIFDIDIIKAVKYGFCPDDADLDVKQVAISLNSKGGECCISELYRYFQVSGLVKPVTLEEIEAIDRHERF
jgi:3-deoxy-D-manno-octulosonate 8-phosphate phosphatase (KDO 8-P phosphatase)